MHGRRSTLWVQVFGQCTPQQSKLPGRDLEGGANLMVTRFMPAADSYWRSDKDWEKGDDDKSLRMSVRWLTAGIIARS